MQSNLPVFLKNQTCAVTGHRDLSEKVTFEKVKEDLLQIYKSGYTLFLVGMAKGFDLLCAKAVLKLKEEYPEIKICGVIPCKSQEKYYEKQEKEEYEEILEKADYIAKEEREYFRGCMLKRNDYMLDNSSLLYAYYEGREKGGTLYTVNGAKKRGLTVVYYE